MKRAERIIALLLTILSLCLCPAWQTLAEAATAGDLTAYTNEEGGTVQLSYTDARSRLSEPQRRGLCEFQDDCHHRHGGGRALQNRFSHRQYAQTQHLCGRRVEDGRRRDCHESHGQPEILKSQLIAAYSIGWGWSWEAAERFPQIVPATGEDDIGCVISYDAEAPEVEDTIVTPRGERHFAINPLNWRTDDTPADKAQNKGSVFVKNDLTATEVPQLCGAYIEPARGALKVTDVDPAEYNLRPDVFPEGAYHIYDLNFFWNNLKENIEVRMAAYQTENKG